MERSNLPGERPVRVYPHADLDAFFTSIKQLLDSSLRKAPMAVGGGVVLAVSYEAKTFGSAAACRGDGRTNPTSGDPLVVAATIGPRTGWHGRLDCPGRSEPRCLSLAPRFGRGFVSRSFDTEQKPRLRDGLDTLVSFSVRIQSFGTRQDRRKHRLGIFIGSLH